MACGSLLYRRNGTRVLGRRSFGSYLLSLLAVLILVTCSTHLWAQQPDVEIQPRVHFVTQPGAALKWVGQRSTIGDELDEIILQNAGEARIAGFQVGWTLFIPNGCGVRESGVPRNEVHLAPYQEQTILPGQTVIVGPYHVSSESIRNFARRAHSPAVVAQAGIVRIRFSGRGENVYPLEQHMSFAQEPAKYPCEAYQKSANAENALKTFFGSEFRFQYASLLIPCQKKEQETGDGYYWAQDSCSAYFPVCDDSGSQGSTTIVCVAYPKEKFADAPTFEGAAFSVSAVEGASTESDCLGGSPDWVIAPKGTGKTATLNDVKFKVFEVGEGGMSQSVDGEVYRTFHGNKCYQLSIRIAEADSGAFDGDINEFTKEDMDEVRSRLEHARDSFLFLK